MDGPQRTPELRKSSQYWDSRELEQILESRSFGSEDPVLRINVNAFKDRLARFREPKEDSEPPTKQARVNSIRAQCSLTIWENQSQQTVVEQTVHCTIRPKIKPLTGERSAELILDEPFLVGLKQLLVERFRPCKTSSINSYTMQITFTATKGSDDNWPPLPLHNCPPPKKRELTDAGGWVRFPMLVAKWSKLPRCPENEREALLEVLASQDFQTHKPKLSLIFDAQWVSPLSPLAALNAQKRTRPSPAPPPPMPSAFIKTTWVFEGTEPTIDDLEFCGYICPLCGGREFNSQDIYHFHLITSHDLLKFRLRSESSGTKEQREVLLQVEIDVNDHYRGKAGSKLDDREMSFATTGTFYDLEHILKTDQALYKRGLAKRNTRLPASDMSRSASREANRVEAPLVTTSRSADMVPDLPPRKKKTFPVPPAPAGTKFYRLKSKRPLQEGEYLSESDDEIDETWLLQKHADTIESFRDLTQKEKEFIKIYDWHMLNEDLASDLHAGEALIRFCRLYQRWLQNIDMKIEFLKKATALKQQGCIGSKLIVACLKIINDPASAANEQMEVDEPIHQNSSIDAQKQLRTIPSPTGVGHVYGLCQTCHADIQSLKALVCCANPSCLRRDHHLTCAGLVERSPCWTCDFCAKSSTTSKQVVAESPQAVFTELPIRSSASSPIQNDASKRAPTVTDSYKGLGRSASSSSISSLESFSSESSDPPSPLDDEFYHASDKDG